MRILLIDNQNAFKAKNQRIRKAGDIARKAKNEYPMLSKSYANRYYHLNSWKMEKKAKILLNKIEQSRFEFLSRFYKHPLRFYRTYTLLSSVLPVLKRTKVGNCEENSTVAYAALCANGYTNSLKVDLCYQTQLVDKKTKKVLYSEQKDLDHSLVVTSMSQNPKDKKDIVVDNWLGFADSISGALGRFKEIYTERGLKKAREENIKKIKHDYAGSIKDCEYRSKMVLIPNHSDLYLDFIEPTEAELIKGKFSNLKM